jgi:hypothetical protein
VRGLRAAALALVCAACAATPPPAPPTPPIERLEAAWRLENQQAAAGGGQKVFTATPDQARRAATAVLPQLGLALQQPAVADPLSLTAFSTDGRGDWTWNAEVRASEAERIRGLFAPVGRKGAVAAPAPMSDVTLLVRLAPAPPQGVTVTVRVQPYGRCLGEPCADELAPTATRLALARFWTAFEPALAQVTKAEADEALAAKQPRTPRRTAPKPPPSRMKLPPSRMKLPPAS